MTFGSSAGGTMPGGLRGSMRQPSPGPSRSRTSRPVEQKRLVAKIDQRPEAGRLHLPACVLRQQLEHRIVGRRQLLEREELAHVGRKGDKIAGALGGLLVQHGPEPGAHVRRRREQQGGAVRSAFRHKGRKLVLARRAPAVVFGDKQPIIQAPLT